MNINSLKTRVLLWFGGVVTIILLLFSISFEYFMNQSINNNIKAHLNNDAIEILTDFQESATPPPDYELYAKEMIVFKNKKLLYKSTTLDIQKIYQLIDNQTQFKIYEDSEDDDIISAVYILEQNGFTVVVYKTDIDNKIDNFEDILLFLDPILLSLLLFTTSKLIDKILAPIKRITKTAKNISVDNFTNTIKLPKKDDEIKELVDAFNMMVLRLKDGVENLDRFNNDVSHELKTPLTVIQGEVEITLRKLRDPKEYQQSLKIIGYEANQIQSIVENLLLLTRYTPQNIKDSFELSQIDSILLDVLDRFREPISSKNLSLKIINIENVSTFVNPRLIYSIFFNLIDNGVKYTPDNKNIFISLYEKNKQLYFEIKDEGIGIEKTDILKITDRFYRVDESRNKEIKGFGLGLSIVKNSVELHNGSLTINSEINIGTDVLVRIPFFTKTTCT